MEFDVSQVDELMAAYIELLWRDGGPKSYANLQYVIPRCRRQFTQSWKLVSSWNKLELLIRATPLTPEVAMAFSGSFFQMGLEAHGLYDYGGLQHLSPHR